MAHPSSVYRMKNKPKNGFSKGCNQTDSDIDKYINKQEKAKKNKGKKNIIMKSKP